MPDKKPTLYNIIAINRVDTSIGPACLIDQNRIVTFFKKLTDFISLPYKEILVPNEKFNVDGIRNIIKEIDPGSNDIVVFAYSGHGFRFSKEDTRLFPQLALFTNAKPTVEIIQEETINLEEIFNLIRAKSARLNIVFADCCNNDLDIKRFEATNADLHSWPIDWVASNCSKLFEKDKGSFLVASAEKGQLSACTRTEGGFFTFSLFQFIETAFAGPQLDWQAIIRRAGEFAALKSSRALCGEKACAQNAISKIVL